MFILGPSIDATYQVSVHLAEVFQRRRLKCEKLTNDRRRMSSDGKSSRCLWQGELKILINYENAKKAEIEKTFFWVQKKSLSPFLL
jgi:hypothetical protein